MKTKRKEKNNSSICCRSWLFFAFIVALASILSIITFYSIPEIHPDGSYTPLRNLFPLSRSLKLENNVTVEMPFFADKTSGIIIFNLIDVDHLKQHAASVGLLGGAAGGQNYVPATLRDPADGKTKAVVLFWLMNYNISTAGPYYEVVSSMLVRHKNDPNSGKPYDCISRSICPMHLFLNDPSVFTKSGRTWVTSETTTILGRKWLAIDKSVQECNYERSDDGNEFDIHWYDYNSVKADGSKGSSQPKAHFHLKTPESWFGAIIRAAPEMVKEMGLLRLLGLFVRLNILDDPCMFPVIGTGSVHEHPVFRDGKDDPATVGFLRMSLFDLRVEPYDAERHSIQFFSPNPNVEGSTGGDGLERLNLEPVALQRVDQLQMVLPPSYNYVE